MSTGTKKFVVMTVGRSGSTALMEVIERSEDVGVPNKNLDCPDNELVDLNRLDDRYAVYGDLCGRPLTTTAELVDAFFEANSTRSIAGFKSMPARHRADYDALIARPDITFITLDREDTVALAASFLLAKVAGTWRRHGGEPLRGCEFKPGHDMWVRGNLKYITKSRARLAQIRDPIALTYERLCEPEFSCPKLDRFFGGKIALADPKPPTSPTEYITNFEYFRTFVEQHLRQLSQQS